MEYNSCEGKKADQSALADDMVVSIAVYLVSFQQHLCYNHLI